MIKPQSLRAALTASLDERHHINQNADRLIMAISNGRLLTSGRPGQAYQQSYTLQISLLDFVGQPEEVEIPLLVWLQRYQNDLISTAAAADSGLNLTYDLLDAGKYDIHIDLKLTETVAFTSREGGGYDVVFPSEPEPMLFEEGRGEPLHAVYLDGVQILHCTAHPAAGLD